MTLTAKEQDLIAKYRKLNTKQKESIDTAISAIFTQDAHYSIKAAADVIGVTYRTCAEYIRTGKLKAHKVGGKWSITTSDLKAFIDGK